MIDFQVMISGNAKKNKYGIMLVVDGHGGYMVLEGIRSVREANKARTRCRKAFAEIGRDKLNSILRSIIEASKLTIVP